MSATVKNTMREVMSLAWQFAKRNGFTMSEALKVAWRNIKLRKAMSAKIVRFWFQKVDGTLREAWGTLNADLMPVTQGSGRKPNDTVQVYYDTEKAEFRCFKRANLMRVA